MTFKATAAVLALLPMLAGALHSNALPDSRPVIVSAEHDVIRPSHVAEPAAAQARAHTAMLLGGVVSAAKQAGLAARSRVPEPRALLWLGLALLMFGVWRGKQARNRESK